MNRESPPNQQIESDHAVAAQEPRLGGDGIGPLVDSLEATRPGVPIRTIRLLPKFQFGLSAEKPVSGRFACQEGIFYGTIGTRLDRVDGETHRA